MNTKSQDERWNFGVLIDARSLYVAVRRRLVLAAVLFAIPFYFGASFVMSRDPVFTSESLVLIEPGGAAVPEFSEILPRFTNEEDEVPSQIEIIRSPRLAELVIDQTRLDLVPEFNPAIIDPNAKVTLLNKITEQLKLSLENVVNMLRPGTASATSDAASSDELVMKRFAKSLSVSQRGISRVISVQFTSVDPALAANVANTLADTYIQDQIQARLQAAEQISQTIAQRIEELSDNFSASERTLEEQRAVAGLFEDDTRTTVLAQNIGAANAELLRAQADLFEAKARITPALDGDLEVLLSLPEVQSSELVADFKKQIAEVETLIAERGADLGNRHPEIINLQAQLTVLEGRIEDEVRRVVSTLEAELQSRESRVTQLSQQLTNFESQYQEASQERASIRSLERTVEVNRGVSEVLLTRLLQTAQQQEIITPEARVVSYASVPPLPSSLDRKLLLAAAAFISGFFAMVICFALERFSGRVKSSNDLVKLNVPVHSLVPITPGRRRTKPADYLIDKPASPYAEALRLLYTRGIAEVAPKKLRSILVTSATSGEGKSTAAISLARMLSQTRSVTLVDCDVRRGTVRKELKIDEKKGLTDYLDGSIKLDEAIREDKPSKAKVIPSGTFTPNSLELFRSDAMKRLLSEEDSPIDSELLILDAPPTLALADPLVLCNQVSLTLVVVKWDSTPLSSVEATVERLRSAGAAHVAIALTQVRETAWKLYGDPLGYDSEKLQSYYAQ